MKFSEQAEKLKKELKVFDEDDFIKWEEENHVIGSMDILNYIINKGD